MLQPLPSIHQGPTMGSTGGPVPLVRNTGDRLELQEAGIELLNSLPQKKIVTVFAVGGSRAGKSTLGNSLLEGKVYFPTSDGFSPVTEGIDVATLVVDKHTVLVYCDCEGSFHINGSHTNPHSFGPMAALAYICTDYLAHVSMGNVDERDMQSLAFLASSVHREDDQKPKLLIIINDPRFHDLASDPRSVLLESWQGTNFDKDDPRALTREALQTFDGPDFICLSNLQGEARKYRNEVSELQKLLLSRMANVVRPGRSSGPELVAFLEYAVSELNRAGSVRPEAAVDSVCRQVHLEPLMERIEHEFMKKLKREDGGPHALKQARYVHEALSEYDSKISTIAASASLKSGSRLALGKRLRRMQEVVKAREDEVNKENTSRDSADVNLPIDLNRERKCIGSLESSSMSLASPTVSLGYSNSNRSQPSKEDCSNIQKIIEASEKWLSEYEKDLAEKLAYLEATMTREATEFSMLTMPDIYLPEPTFDCGPLFQDAKRAINHLPKLPEDESDFDTLFKKASELRDSLDRLQERASIGNIRSIGTRIEKSLAELDRQITAAQKDRLTGIERLEKRRIGVENEIREMINRERAERHHRETLSKQMIEGVVRWLALAKAK